MLAAPPRRPPCIALDDGGGSRRIQRGLTVLGWTSATVFATAWLITLGQVAGILALVVAKHVLVAVLVYGLGVDNESRASRRPGAVPLPVDSEDSVDD